MTDEAAEDTSDADEPDPGHLRAGKDRSPKAIRAGAVKLLGGCAELIASRERWSADPNGARSAVRTIFHMNFRRRAGLKSVLVAMSAMTRAVGVSVFDWWPKDRAEMVAAFERARDVLEAG